MKKMIATALVLAALGSACSDEVTHPADQCQEDGAWVAVNWKDQDAIEDIHGVSRACRNIDDLIDTAFEVAIQNGVLQYTP